MKNNKKSICVDYILLTFFILMSGGSFTYGLFGNWPYLLLPLVMYIYINRGYKITNRVVLITILFALLYLLQALTFGGPLTSIIQPTLQIFILVLFTKIIYPNFNTIYVRIITFFAFTSLVIWCISMVPAGYNFMFNFAQGLPQYGVENLWEVREGHETMYTCYLFSYSTFSDIVRNYGPFWEPGRFTIFLTIALMIRLYNNPAIFFDRTNIILLLANITTFSTTGYFALSILFLGYILIIKTKSHTKILLITLLVILISWVLQLDFMSDKVVSQMDDLGSTESRFGAMAYHFLQISRSPIIGYGPHLNKMFNILEMSPNGWTDYMRYVGIPMFITMLVFLYRGIRAYIQNNSKVMRSFAFVIILILAFTQTCMNDPFYYILYFMVFNIGVKTFKQNSLCIPRI